MILIGMYSLWMQRNRRQHGEQTVPIKEAVRWAMDLAFDLWHISQVPARARTSNIEEHWEMPPGGWLKCNADGAFYEQQWRGATGAVLRDDTGAFIRGGARWYDHCLDALSMEAMACRDGSLMARQVGALTDPGWHRGGLTHKNVD
jgi:hypothetical protein